MATLQITKLEKGQSISKLWLGDFMHIVNFLNGVTKPSWSIENIVKNNVNYMDFYYITHVYHESNMVANSIENVVVRC